MLREALTEPLTLRLVLTVAVADRVGVRLGEGVGDAKASFMRRYTGWAQGSAGTVNEPVTLTSAADSASTPAA
jgi:hypothetical protein